MEEVTNPDATPKDKEKAEKKIEVAEEVARIAIESGKKQEIPVEAISAPAIKENNKKDWTNILGISWVKPNDLFGRTYFLAAKNGIYIWPTFIDKENKRVRFIVNNSRESRAEGSRYVDEVWISIGESHEFIVASKTYRLNLINIKKAGKLPSDAAYISVDEK